MTNTGQFFHGALMLDASEWEKNGDHPEDGPEQVEGKVVRYFRRPDVSGDDRCDFCDWTMSAHGWIDSGKDGETVCPGDWIVTEEDGSFFPVHADDFAVDYTPVPGQQKVTGS